MKKIFIALFLCSIVHCCLAQQKIDTADMLDKVTDSLQREGKLLHHSDWVSWYGTDIFVAKCPEKRILSGGYLSYDSGKGWNNIFFSKGDNPVVMATISFGYDFDNSKYILDTITRKLTSTERELFTIRYAALKEMHTDTLYKIYKNTNLNLIPIIINGIKRVYVLTGPDVNGIVIFGNDYLVNFDKNNKVSSVKKLHKNLISINDTDTTSVSTMHTHLAETGDFITATDICTLMSYEKFTSWKTHYVISKNYISIWDCKKDQLVILTMAAWKRIIDDQPERHKQNITTK